jgi:tRNA(Ile)-lysidine synthase
VKQQVLQYIRDQRLLKAGDRVGVAVSGGPDSVALLRVLLELRQELGIVVAVVGHFNHKLRGADSKADERFVKALCKDLGVEFARAEADTAAHVTDEGLEAAARKLRYDFFADLLRTHRLDTIATGHTLDDQAETVLMRLLRGAGTRGLAAILPIVRVELDAERHARVIRPLLGIRRAALLAYLGGLGQDFREDASNRDPQFLRNRVRHELLPLLARDYNPRVAEALAQTAEIARGEQQHAERELSEAARGRVRWKAAPGEGRGALLSSAGFAQLSPALQRRLLQRVSEQLERSLTFEQIEAVRELAGKPGTIELPGSLRAIRDGDELRLWIGDGAAKKAGYEQPLAVPGEIVVAAVGSRFIATNGAKAAVEGGRATPASLVVRNWRPGDRFRPRHSKSAKKVKELLTEKKVTGRERELWPVVAAGDRIVWLRGWGLAADAVAAAGSGELNIEEQRMVK